MILVFVGGSPKWLPTPQLHMPRMINDKAKSNNQSTNQVI